MSLGGDLERAVTYQRERFAEMGAKAREQAETIRQRIAGRLSFHASNGGPEGDDFALRQLVADATEATVYALVAQICAQKAKGG